MKQALLTGLIIVALSAAGSYYFTTLATQTCANSITCVKETRSKITNETKGNFLGAVIDVPEIDLSVGSSQPSQILGERIKEDQEEKRIFVDLSKQTLYAFEGDELFLQTLVSTGKWGKTPTGDFRIWSKFRATKMSGGSGNDYYYLPNVPFVMFYSNDQVSASRGFSLHGTYWHNNFGYEMSHGCVNLRTIDAEVLFNWTTPVAEKSTVRSSKENPGTLVSVCNKIQLREGERPLCLE